MSGSRFLRVAPVPHYRGTASTHCERSARHGQTRQHRMKDWQVCAGKSEGMLCSKTRYSSSNSSSSLTFAPLCLADDSLLPSDPVTDCSREA